MVWFVMISFVPPPPPLPPPPPSLKTSWLKWNPDYDNAAHAFEKSRSVLKRTTNGQHHKKLCILVASSPRSMYFSIIYYVCVIECSLVSALAYRNAKAYDKARDTYERAAEIHYKNHAYPHPTVQLLLVPS